MTTLLSAESQTQAVPRSARARGIWLFIAKVAVTVISFYLISRAVSWEGLVESLSNLQLEWFVLAVAVFWTAQIASFIRCVYVARALGGPLDWRTSARAHFIGLWFNQVLPTSLGGDVVKIAILKSSIGLGLAARVAIIDRISGFMMLMFVLLIQLPFYAMYFEGVNWVVGIGIISSVSILSVLLISHLANVFRTRFNLPFGVRHLAQVMADIWTFRKGRILWQQFWTSLIVHVNGIVTFGLIGLSLGLDVDLIGFFLVVPVVFLVALIPLSFAGWGVREAGAIWLFEAIAIPKESALAMSISFGLLLLLAGLPGLLVWALKK